jgi:hypothetical protein
MTTLGFHNRVAILTGYETRPYADYQICRLHTQLRRAFDHPSID